MSVAHLTDRPTVLPIQPEPTAVHIARDYHPGGCTTALVRTWLNGDAEQCRLCPAGRCRAHAGVCLVQIRAEVRDDAARLFSTVGLRWTPGGVAGGLYFGDHHAGLVDLDAPEVVILNPGPEVLKEHLPKPLSRAAT